MGGIAAWLGIANVGATTLGPVDRIRQSRGVPALGGMIVTPEGFEFLEVSGVRRAGTNEIVTEHDLRHLGSNGKAMTAALYARLVEAGRVQWGAKITDYFPSATLHPGWIGTTIEDLLSHHSGVGDEALTQTWLLSAQRERTRAVEQRAETAKAILSRPPSGKRGIHNYANANYIIAGALMEGAAGVAWEELMRREVFAPLEMTSAGFGAPSGSNPWGHTSTFLGFGGFTPVDPGGIADNPPALGPAGTIHMSLHDYAKFLRIFMSAGNRFLKPDSIARLTTPQGTGDRSYALGWITFQSRPWAKGPVLAHEGSNTMWHAFTAVGPVRRRAVVAVCNAHSGGGDAAAQQLGLELVRRLN